MVRTVLGNLIYAKADVSYIISSKWKLTVERKVTLDWLLVKVAIGWYSAGESDKPDLLK